MIDFFIKLFYSYTKIGCLATDSESLRLKKSALILIPLIIGTAAFFWGLIYIYLDLYISATIPLSYSIISVFNLWHFHKTKNIIPLQKIQLLLVLVLPFFLMWSLGGYALGSFVMIWAFFAPIGALTFEKEFKPTQWFYTFLSLVIFSTLIDQSLAENQANLMPQIAIEIFYLLNISAGLSGIYFLIKYYINEKDRNANKRLQKEHEALLLSKKKLEKANYNLEHIAKHDALTGLPNRYHLKENLNQMIAYANRHQQNIALLFIDLDGFKQVNDSFGHSIGDKVLVTVGERIKALIRTEDLVARIGGDEFAIAICSVTDHLYIEEVSIRLIDEISKSYSCLPSAASMIGASIGISLYPKDSVNQEDIFQFADAAMYHAKENGRGNFQFFDEEINEINKRIHILEGSLQRAINNDEFELFYQPQIDIVNNNIIGAEALIRWNSPDKGLIPPIEFIPLAEKNGMIIEIGSWVFKQVCRHIHVCEEQGREPLRIAINLSAVQFNDEGLVGMIESVLKQENVSPKLIELEITESAVMEQADRAIVVLDRISSLGIYISIDDFGTGYSSLAYLKKFTVDKLKIDRDFIKNLPNDKEDAVLTSTMIMLAKNLELDVLAEGVETKEQVDFLIKHGCNLAQGFHYAKPLSEKEFIKYVSSYSNINVT